MLLWACVLLLALALAVHWRARAVKPNGAHLWSHRRLQALMRREGIRAPAMFVLESAVEGNLRCLLAQTRAHGKALRLATKSVRVPKLIEDACHEMLRQQGSARLMAYSVEEAAFLVDVLDVHDVDVLVAYPTMCQADVELAGKLATQGVKLTLMVSEVEHVQLLARHAGVVPLRVCVDLDVSFRLGSWVHLGAQRSQCRGVDRFEALVEEVLKCRESLRLVGVMAYEAQVAGLQDRSPAVPRVMQLVLSVFKKVSQADVARQRREASAVLARLGVELEFFNGGGTGSIEATASEQCVTEVAAGSGVLQSALFDYYGNGSERVPACCFALQVTRRPEAGVVCCQSGGFVASGAVAVDKSPVAFLPPGLAPLADEGFGEVQTPLKVQAGDEVAEALRPGDFAFFRSAKAGEIAEWFDQYVVIEGDARGGYAVQRVVETYRGAGMVFR